MPFNFKSVFIHTVKMPCMTMLKPIIIEHSAGISRHSFVTNNVPEGLDRVLFLIWVWPAISTHMLLESELTSTASSHGTAVGFSLILTYSFSGCNLKRQFFLALHMLRFV